MESGEDAGNEVQITYCTDATSNVAECRYQISCITNSVLYFYKTLGWMAYYTVAVSKSLALK